MNDLVAAGLGFEPRLPDPESGVLPLHHPAVPAQYNGAFEIAAKLGLSLRVELTGRIVARMTCCAAMQVGRLRPRMGRLALSDCR